MGRMILVPEADFSRISLGKVTPSDDIPIEGISIIGPGMAYGEAEFSARLWPTFTNERSYSWSVVSGDTYAAIDGYGHLTVASGTSEQSVTIRCTSVDNPNIYSEKTIVCDSGTLEYYDYLEGDTTGYILINRFPSLVGATVTTIYTSGNIQNHYMLTNRKAESLNTATSYALYIKSSANTTRVAAGTKGSNDITSTNPFTTKYRSVLQLSSTKTANDAIFTTYDDDLYDASLGDNNQFIKRLTDFTCWLGSYFCIFGFCHADSVLDEPVISDAISGNGKFYGMTVVKDGETLADYRPCKIDEVPCLVDYISGLTYYNAVEGDGITAGNDSDEGGSSE